MGIFTRYIVTFGIVFLALQILFTTPIQASSATDSMVVYWKLDEGVNDTCSGGEDVCDVSGHTNHSTWFGSGGGSSTSTSWISAPSNSISFTNPYGMSFDGTDDYLVSTNNSTLTGNATFSVSLWFYVPSDATTNGSWGRFVDWGTAASGQSAQICIYSNTKNQLFVGQWGTGQASSTTFTNDAWHHAVWVRTGGSDGHSGNKLYLDGSEIPLDINVGSNVTPNVAAGPYYLGGKGSGSLYIENSLDDVRIYSRALTTTEISALAAGGHTTATWDGSSSTNTETAANWDINAVPDPYTKLVIADVTNQPVATANIGMTGLTINSGAWFDLSTYNLTMNDSGSFTNNGTLRLKNSQTISNFTNDTDSGTILVNATSDTTGLKSGNSYYNLNLNDGLVGYWNVDETSGTTAADSSGYQNTAAYSGNVAPNTDLPTTNFSNSRSMIFDGTTDYLSVPDDNSLDITRVTLSAWVKPADGNNIAGAAIICKGTGGGGEVYCLDFPTANDLTPRFYFYPTVGVYTVSSSVALTPGVWSHVVGTYDGTSYKIFVNGTERGSGTFTGSLNSNSHALTIGCRQSGSTDYDMCFDGKIDDVRVYNRALTSDAITALAEGDEPSTTLASLTLSSNLDVNGDLVLNGGTLDVNTTNNYSINLAGDWENNGGVFTARAGLVTLDGNDQTINSSNHYYDLTKSVNAPRTLTFAQRSTTTVDHTTTFSGASSNLLSLRSAVGGTQFKLDSQGTRTFSYLDVEDSNNINSTAIAYDSTITYGSNLTNWTTVAPSSTPTPTPTPTSNSSSTAPPPPSCNDTAPTDIPVIVAIETTSTTASLVFTPISRATGYQVFFGSENSDQYGATETVIRSLSPGTKYYFKMRAVNGCAGGELSGEFSAITKTTNSITSSIVEKTKEVVSEVPVLKNTIDQKIEFESVEENKKPTIITYVVEQGDTLWSLANKFLGEGFKFPDIVSQNKNKYPSLENNQSLEVGMELEIPNLAFTFDEAKELFPESPQVAGYDLDIKILTNSGEPLRGIQVILHSDPIESITDNDGVAHFEGVPEGEHKVVLAIDNYQGSQAIMVTGDTKNIEFVMQINLVSEFSSPRVLTVIGGLIGIIGILTFLLIKKNKK